MQRATIKWNFLANSDRSTPRLAKTKLPTTIFRSKRFSLDQVKQKFPDQYTYEKTAHRLSTVCCACTHFNFCRAVCAARAYVAVFAKPGREFHGLDSRSVRRLLPIFLRRVAAEEPNTAGPNSMGRLQQAVPGQPG